MSISIELIKEEISKYSNETEKLLDELQQIDNRRIEVEQRLIQLTGSISALNALGKST